jgi:hypothetical protein
MNSQAKWKNSQSEIKKSENEIKQTFDSDMSTRLSLLPPSLRLSVIPFEFHVIRHKFDFALHSAAPRPRPYESMDMRVAKSAEIITVNVQ